MAGSKGSKYFNIFLDYQVWLKAQNREGRVDDQLIELLKEIGLHGSLKKAAIKKGLSYRKAWGDIKEAEEFLELSLIVSTRGGKDGGLSLLTEDGRELIAAFDELHYQFDQAIHRITRQFFNKLNKKDLPETE
ncbi:MAG: LysR family transcriptional regulator [Bacteroidales bacterium]|nr:LysR family transcriptional regulator [Bacteroidales bacterium]